MCNICNESPCYKELAKVSGISPAPWHSDTLHLSTHLAQNWLKLFSEPEFRFSTAFPMVKPNLGPKIPSFQARGNVSANMHALPHKQTPLYSPHLGLEKQALGRNTPFHKPSMSKQVDYAISMCANTPSFSYVRGYCLWKRSSSFERISWIPTDRLASGAKECSIRLCLQCPLC